MLNIKKNNILYSNDQIVDGTGGAFTSDVNDSYEGQSLSTTDVSAFLDAYGIPHGEFEDIEADTYWCFGTHLRGYELTDSEGNQYTFIYDEYGHAEVIVQAPQGGYVTYSVYDYGDGDYDVCCYDVQGPIETMCVYEEDGKRCLEYFNRNTSEDSWFKYKCIDNGDGTTTIILYKYDPQTADFIEISREEFTGNFDAAQEAAAKSLAETAAAEADYSSNAALKGLFNNFDFTGGPGDAWLDGMFYDSATLAEVYLDTHDLIERTREVKQTVSSFCSSIDGSSITNFETFMSAIGDSFKCASCSLPASGESNCLSVSLIEFFDNMSDALDRNYKLEHSNIGAFDEGSVNDDDITVYIEGDDGKKYNSYSRYLRGQHTSTKVNEETNMEYHYYEDRDYVPFYAKTTTKGTVGHREAEYVNEVKNMWHSHDTVVEGTASVDFKKVFDNLMGKDPQNPASAEYEYGIEGEVVVYSNSNDFKVYNSDGSIYRRDTSGVEFGHLKGKATISAGTKGIKIHGEASWTTLNFNLKHYDRLTDSINYALDLNLLQLGGELDININPNICQLLQNRSIMNSLGSGNVQSLENFDISVENQDYIKIDGKVYGRVAQLKYKFAGDIFTGGKASVEGQVDALGFEFSREKGWKTYYVDKDTIWPKFKFKLDFDEMYYSIYGK